MASTALNGVIPTEEYQASVLSRSASSTAPPGLSAGSIAALYPYFVNHDTALQETSTYTCLTAIVVLPLYRTAAQQTRTPAVLAGGALGLALLARASLLPFVPMALLWLLSCVSGGVMRHACPQCPPIGVGLLHRGGAVADSKHDSGGRAYSHVPVRPIPLVGE